MKHLKKVLLASFVAGLFASWLLLPSAMAFTLSPPLKVWSNGEVLKASDLNSNFSTIANAAVRLLVNSDISGSAAISHSKFATPALVPKAFATVVKSGDTTITNPCNVNGACTTVVSSRVSSAARTAAGLYTVTLAYTPANAVYTVAVTQGYAGALALTVCSPTVIGTAAPQIAVNCKSIDGTSTNTDAIFNVVVYDNDN